MSDPAALTGYQAAEGYLDQLRTELEFAGAAVAAVHGRLILAEGPPLAAAWAQNAWFDVQRVAIGSICQDSYAGSFASLFAALSR